MRTPRFSLLHEARVVAATAAFVCGLTLMVVGWFDPFGRSHRAAQDAAEVVLCTQLEANQQRLTQLEGHVRLVGFDGLTRNERDVLVLQRDSHGRLLAALNEIGGECR